MTAERPVTPRPRTTTPMGAVRNPDKIDADEQTRTMDPIETARHQKFAPDELVKTAITPQSQSRSQPRQRTTTPMGTIQSEPTPSVILASQQVLTREVPPGMLEKLAAEGAVEVRVGAPNAADLPRTQVWVATHKPPERSRCAADSHSRARLGARGQLSRVAPSPAGARRSARHRRDLGGAQKRARRPARSTWRWRSASAGASRVLLVEANLRAPALAALFGFMPPECFSAQLQRHSEKPLEPWSVVEVFSPSLHVLAVKPGRRRRQAAARRAGVRASRMEMLAQAGYDYIVIDTPPVLGAADVNLIEDSADGVLFTAWSRSTSSRSLRAAVEQLAPAKLLGVTLLDV